jgi:multiple sugar transport system ATP-binding protein
LREALRVELQHLQKTQGSTTLFVTHDQVEALTMADQIGVLDQGRLVQVGTPDDIYDRPATTFVAQLVGTPGINLVKASRDNGTLHIEESEVQLPLPSTTSKLPQYLILGVRPEDVQLVSDGNFVGEIILVEPLGVETILHIKTGQQTLLSTVTGMTDWRIGNTIRFNVMPERVHYFEPSGQRITI